MTVTTETFQLVLNAIRTSGHPCLIAHRHPDGDTLGAAVAAYHLFKKLGKAPILACLDEIPGYLSFLGEEVTLTHELPDPSAVDLAMAFDASSADYTGFDPERVLALKPLVVVDHHATNTEFGTINLIDREAAATCEIMFAVITALGIAIDKRIATALLTGIFTDTNGFENANTTDHVLTIASSLLRKGARLRLITKQIFKSRKITTLKLWGRALERLRKNQELGIATTVLTLDDLSACGAREEDAEGLANLLNIIADVNAALILRETSDGMIKGSLRTTSDAVDVAKLAQLLGGGGHKKAAGFSIEGRIEKTASGWKVV